MSKMGLRLIPSTMAHFFVVILAIQSVSTSKVPGVCETDDNGTCTANFGRHLSPADLPMPKLFDDFDTSTTVTVSNTTLTVKPGTIRQMGKHLREDDDNSRSKLVVLPELLPRSVVAEILVLLRGHEDADVANGTTTIQLDQDPDSVDGMTSQEIFLDNDSLRLGQSSKGFAENMEERKELREKLRALTDVYAYQILMPFLEEWYGKEACGRDGRKCTPCYSLIRRYRQGERQSHAPHNDQHSFITVVVSLTDYGREYRGGLYVSTKNSERNFVKLSRGDAVVHQGDLHHGVKVLDTRDDGGPSERWSWILWFRDSETCEDHSFEWYDECARAGNPTCLYLSASKQGTSEGVIATNQKASDAGHSQASVKLAYAYLKKLPSNLTFNRTTAKDFFQQAILSSNEPDGHYGVATLLLGEMSDSIYRQSDIKAKQNAALKALGSPKMLQAVYHLEEAAKGGHVFAMFNLGICYTIGYAEKDGRPDYELAIEWFEASGIPEGLAAKAMYLQTVGRSSEADLYGKKATILGFGSPWRKNARERTGSGGSSGAKLNLPWPPYPNGKTPPEW